jgi:mannose-1-phosphate guanylyltransferase
MLDWLHSHGINDIVVSCGHMAAGVKNVLGDGSGFGVRLRYAEEPEPLGTGGALKFAEPLLDDGRFVMLNGDVLTDLDLTEQIKQHERTDAKATLALTPVEDPWNYGLVRTNGDGSVTGFVEKPARDQIDTNRISAGAYILEPEVFDLLEKDAPASIERDVFPALVGDGLYGYSAEGYWLDIGTPERYLQATFDILEGTVQTQVQNRLEEYLYVSPETDMNGRTVPSLLVEDNCTISEGARVGGRVMLDTGVSIGPGSTVERSVLLRGAKIGANCSLSDCIIGGGVEIGDNTQIRDLVTVGEGATIGSDNVIANGMRVFPGVSIPDKAIKF